VAKYFNEIQYFPATLDFCVTITKFWLKRYMEVAMWEFRGPYKIRGIGSIAQ
jgi:hypothetical protein